MNFRKARKVLKHLSDKLRAYNFGDVEVKTPQYSAQHVDRATTRCNRQQKNWKELEKVPLMIEHRTPRNIPVPGFA